MLKENLGARTESQNRAANINRRLRWFMQAKKSSSSQAFQCHPTPADGLSYKSNWLILYTACYLNCFSLPIVPLWLQATLQPNSSPVPPFYTISDLYLFTVCAVLNRGVAAAFTASVLCTYMHKEEGEEPKYKLLQMDITVYLWLKCRRVDGGSKSWQFVL